jgi:hypothetical protein
VVGTLSLVPSGMLVYCRTLAGDDGNVAFSILLIEICLIRISFAAA